MRVTTRAEFEENVYPGSRGPAKEGQRFDAKRGLSQGPDAQVEIAKDIGAFANAEGGLIAYGLREEADGVGTLVASGVVDLGDTQPLCRKIEEAVSVHLHGIEPRPSVVALTLEHGEHVIVVNVRPSARLAAIWSPGQHRICYPLRTGENTRYLNPREVEGAIQGYRARSMRIRVEDLMEASTVDDVELFHIVNPNDVLGPHPLKEPVKIFGFTAWGVELLFGEQRFVVPYEWIDSVWLALNLAGDVQMNMFVRAAFDSAHNGAVHAVPRRW